MIEELTQILNLLGDVSEIAGWVLGAWLTFKAVILLSTTGAIVFLVTLGIKRLSSWLELMSNNSVKSEVNKKINVITDVEIKGMCIRSDGTYESVVNSLRQVKDHVNTCSGSYIHSQGADWLADAVAEKIERDKQPPGDE